MAIIVSLTFSLLEQEPIVIQGSNLVDSAKLWDLDYLKDRMTGKYTVIVSNDHKFKYHDEKKLKNDFKPLTRRVQMKFEEFVDKMNNWKEGEERQVERVSVRMIMRAPILNRVLVYV